MSDDRTRRLIALIAALISSSTHPTRRFTKADLFDRVPLYSDDPARRDREFSSDKRTLRDVLGVEVLTIRDETQGDTEYYALPPGRRLPQVRFTAAESLVVRQAARAWCASDSSLKLTRTLAVLSPSLTPADEDEADLPVTFRLRHAGMLAALLRAISERQAVTFRYQPSGAAASERTVEPWLVAPEGGRFYLRGFDRDREAPRTFRLSRIRGSVDPIGEPGQITIPADTGPLFTLPLVAPRVRLIPGTHADLRLRTTDEEVGADGSVTLTLERDRRDYWLRTLLRAGPDVTVLGPDDLVDEWRTAWVALAECEG